MMGLMHTASTFRWGKDSLTDLPIHNLLAFFTSLMLFVLVEGIFAQQIINGALANAISLRYHNQPVSLLSAYNLGLPRIVSLIGGGILIALIMGTVVVIITLFLGGIFVIILGVGSSQGAGLSSVLSFFSLFLMLIGMLAIIVAVGVIALLLLFVTQSIVLERRTPWQALSRSLQLVRRSFWRVVGIVLVLYILVQAITLIPTSALGGAIGIIFDDPIQDMMMRQTLSTLVGYLAQIVVLPLLLIGYTLLYYDLRIRQEGYDLQLRVDGD
jgi:hypothetical protein